MAFFKYASDDEIIQDYLPEAVSDLEKETIARMNEAVSAFVDRYTNRCPDGQPKGAFLPAAATATVRRCRGENRNYLRLPIHVAGTVSVSGVSSNQYYEAANGWLYYRADFHQPESENYFDDFADAAYHFWKKGHLYLVTARWGFAETPAAIIDAVKQIVAKQFSAGQGVLGETSPTGFVIERDLPKNAALLLDQFKANEYEII